MHLQISVRIPKGEAAKLGFFIKLQNKQWKTLQFDDTQQLHFF